MMTAERVVRVNEADFSLYQMLKPEVLADPYPLYRRIRERETVHWDPFLHSWVVSGYADVVTVLSKYKAARTPTPEQMEAMGLSVLQPYAKMMLQQMLFMDAPSHTRLRALCGAAFTPKRIEHLRESTSAMANGLVDLMVSRGQTELMADFANPLPAMVLVTLMGLPEEDRDQIKKWSCDLVELLGNFEHDPHRIRKLMTSVNDVQAYLRVMVAEQRTEPRDGVLSILLSAEFEGSRLTDEEVVANIVLMLSGGLEETTNLIGSGMFSMLQRPEQLAEMRDCPHLRQAAVEEILRFESPTQHTGRIAPEDVVLGGKSIKKGASLIALIAAANRDPARFDDPDRMDFRRADNRHVAFGWASHYCLGAPLTRLVSQIAFTVLLGRLPGLTLVNVHPEWRGMAAMRGLASLHLNFDSRAAQALQDR